MTPSAFRSNGALRALNIVGVGVSLSAVTSVTLALLFDFEPFLGLPGSAFFALVPTLLAGTLWAWLVRSPRAVTRAALSLGWLLTAPLAMLDAGLIAAASAGSQAPGKALEGFVAGATVGVVLWGPALVMTLLAYGLPIVRAQALAEQGMAGEERGERVIGLTVAAISLLALGGASLCTAPVGRRGEAISEADLSLALAGLGAMAAVSGLGLALGSSAALLSLVRARRRRRFVAEVLAGSLPGYRVEEAPRGKVLVRLVSGGEGYRVGETDEELFLLDEQGEAKQALVPEGSR